MASARHLAGRSTPAEDVNTDKGVPLEAGRGKGAVADAQDDRL